MAKQRGPFKIEGTLGDVTFLKTQDGYLVKEKTSIRGSRIATDQAFQRTRENNAEFGRAGKSGKLVRHAFGTLVQQASDSKLASRLVKQMLQIVKADTSLPRGQRAVQPENVDMLQGFNFNITAPITTTLAVPYTTTIDRAASKLTVAIPAFIPLKEINAPAGSTHCKLVSAGAIINFGTERFETVVSESAMLPLTNATTAAFNLENTLSQISTDPMLLLLGVQFYQEVNNVQYLLNDHSFNALAIVKTASE